MSKPTEIWIGSHMVRRPIRVTEKAVGYLRGSVAFYDLLVMSKIEMRGRHD